MKKIAKLQYTSKQTIFEPLICATLRYFVNHIIHSILLQGKITKLSRKSLTCLKVCETFIDHNLI